MVIIEKYMCTKHEVRRALIQLLCTLEMVKLHLLVRPTANASALWGNTGLVQSTLTGSPSGRHSWFHWCRSEPVSVWELASFGLSREGSSTKIASVCPLVGNERAGRGGGGSGSG